jgi:hypothetical protein
MHFRTAVEATLGSDAYQTGLHALCNADRNRIDCRKIRRLTGSVNFETTLRPTHGNDPIWDYGIGLQVDGRNDRAIWIEVHPASSSHVNSMLKKAAWLRTWLNESSHALRDITDRNMGLVWISSGSVHLPKGSSQARKLAQAGIRYPSKFLDLDIC